MSFILIGLVATSFLLALAAAVTILANNSRSSTHRWLAIFLVFAGSWSFVINLQDAGRSLDYNLVIVRLTFVSSIIMAYAILNFVAAVARIKLTRLTRLLLFVSMAGLSIAMFAGLIVPAVNVVEGAIVPERLPTYYLVITYILFMCVMALYLLNRARRRAVNKASRNQLSTIFYGLGSGIILGALTNIVLPNLLGSITPARYAWMSIVVWTIVLMYAVVRNRFLDIRLAAVRTSAYVLSLATLAAVYYLAATLVSEIFLHDSSLTQPLVVVLALVLSFIFQPIKQFFDRLTNRLFYKDNYNVDDFFSRLNKALSSTTDLRYLLEKASSEIGSTLKSEQVVFVVYTTSGRHITVGTPGHAKLPSDDLDNFDSRSENIIEASRLEDDDHLYRLMMSHRLELVMPLRRDSLLVGYLGLGYHRTSSYSTRDIKVLTAIRDELIIAIQNSTSVHEVKELNASLQQRIADATRELRTSNHQLQRLDKAKDEFVSMASHQLRTPLTSVKGYISMVLEGDVGKITDKQRELLNEAFVSSERMVRLIGDFLNVSRLQTGKFLIDKRPVDLAKIVRQEIDGLATNAASRSLKFVYKSPSKFPKLNLDEDKIRQVIMNFADNAIYYSKEGSSISVSLKQEKNYVWFTVKDTGIGVPRSEQSQLFNKFYRASNARRQRPDGTGVGLFLAKKVINDHGGDVIFQSAENKGSTFGFKLPVAELLVRDDTDKLNDKPDNNRRDATSD